MIGLKLFLKEFSHLTGGELSHDALYARQRELTRCGLFPVREGRGPGSGVPLSADTLAVFLIGLLATDSLTDLGERTAQLCDARPLDFPKGGGWGTRRSRATFRSDVAKALMGSRIAGFRAGEDLGPDVKQYAGIQVTWHWRGVILGHRPIRLPDGTERDSIHGVEYTLGQEAKNESDSASILSRTVSLEREWFWALCMKFRHFMEIK
jgi:hypothetical protein